MKVLYVEDNALDADLVCRQLERCAAHIRMDVVGTLSEARARLAESAAYDVVLTDLNLSDGNGLELLSEIRQLGLPVAVVVLTGAGDEHTAVAALKIGADDYVVKRDAYAASLAQVLDAALTRFRAEAARRVRPLRVLYAEHNASDVELTRLHLARHAPYIHLSVVPSATEVLRQLPRTAEEPCVFDVLLLDYRLAGLNALELLKTLCEERQLDVPVVLVTGHGEEEVAVQALRLGAAHYLVKHPGYLYELPTALEDAYHRAQLAREQAALRKKTEELESYFTNALDLLCVADTNGRFRRLSKSWESTLGYTLEELQEWRFLDLVHPEDFEATVQVTSRLESQEKVVDFVNRYRCKDGSYRWIEWRSFPAGKLIYAVARDITERKQAEEARLLAAAELRQAQKLEVVGRLAGGVAHDFNNMLSVILGYSEQVLWNLEPDNPLRDDLEQIRKAAQRSAELTAQLLAFARNQTVSPVTLDLNQAVADRLKMLGRMLREEIVLNFTPAAQLWKIRIDPVQIDQILANLAVNARDAVPDVGAVTIATANVTVNKDNVIEHPGVGPGGYVTLSVSDTGVGMNAETIERIFDPFFTTKEVGKGTGLGLATVYGIVKQNDGFIRVRSEPGAGTTFLLYFPKFHGETADAPEAAEGAPSRGAETVLIVEDEAAVLALAKHALERQGYTVLSADTPAQACSDAEQHDGVIHLLITDVIMPAMNGKELKARIEKIRPGIKTLFMSGYTADIVAERGVLEGGIDFIQKPFSIRDLTAKVRHVLNRVYGLSYPFGLLASL